MAGPLAVVTGGFNLYFGWQDTQKYLAQGDVQMAWASGLNAASGTLAMAGGIALLIPGAQPVAAVLFGLSAIASVGSLVVENWDAIQKFFTRPQGPYPGIIPPEK